MSAVLLLTAVTWVGRGLYRDLTVPDSPEVDTQAAPGREGARAGADTSEAKSSSEAENGGELEHELRELDVGLALTGGGLAASAAGILVAPPLALFTLPCVMISMETFAGRAWTDLRDKQSLTFSAVEFMGLVAALASGYVVLSALGLTVYHAGRRGLLTARRKTREDLGQSLDDWAERIWVIRDGEELELDLADLAAGDHIVISAGQTLPCDGVLLSGTLAVDEHMLTGESTLIEKAPGDLLLAMTLVASGRGIVEAQRAGAETIAGRLAALIEQTESHEQRVQSEIETLADASAGPSLAVGGLGLVLGGLRGATAGIWANCIDAMWLSAPLSMLGLTRAAARHGVLIRDGRSLDLLAEIDTVVFDKTGTLTLGTLELVELHPAPSRSRDELLRLAAGAERRQAHPIAAAILEAARAAGLRPSELEAGDPRYEVGLGLHVEVEGSAIMLGSQRLLERAGVVLPAEHVALLAAAGDLGRTTICMAVDGDYAGMLELAPALRSEAAQTVRMLEARGLDTLILSGDDEAPTRALAAQLGITRWHARMLPEDKRDLIVALRAEGRRVCFVGDGINDALAMRHCEVSVSLAGSSAIALDSAQIILSDGYLGRLDAAIECGNRQRLANRRMLGATVVSSSLATVGLFVIGLGPAAMFGAYASAQTFSMGVVLRSMRWSPTAELPPNPGAREPQASTSTPDSAS